MRIRHLLFLSIILALLSACRDPSMDLDEYALEDQKLVSFSFDSDDNAGLSYTCDAVFEGTIAYVSLPDGTDRSSLIPRFEARGKGLLVNGAWQFSGSTVQDFTSAVSYDLVKTDGSRIQYTVVAGYENLSGNSLYEFSFEAGTNALLAETVTGVIDGNDITFYFPYGTDMSDFVPSFVVPGSASVIYNNQILTSGGSFMNPADGGSIIVEFDDGTSKGYHVISRIKNQEAVYVSTTGAAVNPGTQLSPLNDVSDAYTMAVTQGIGEIRIAAGTYTLSAPLVINSNIKIKGGYSTSDWSDRVYMTPDDRVNLTYRTYINSTDMTVGVATDYNGNITFSGSSVNASTLLEGIVVMCTTSSYNSSVDIEAGASPVIRFSTLNGANATYNSAVSVFDSSPSIYSSDFMGQGELNDSYGILISGNSEPEISSCVIQANTGTGAPSYSYGVYLTDGADGVFCNNFIEAKASATGEAASVYMDSDSGEFYNNIFSLVSGGIKERQFWESASGNTPDVLKNNVFSNTNDGTTEIYQKGDGSDLFTAEDVNAIGYSGVSDNYAYLFSTESSYEIDASSGTIPPVVAGKGIESGTSWTKDLYGSDRGSSWSIGPVEVDYCSYDTPYLGFYAGTDGSYDGIWSSLSISEAIALANDWDSIEAVYEGAGGGYTISNAPEMEIRSDLLLVNDNLAVILQSSTGQPYFIIDDGDSGNDIDVFIKGFTFDSCTLSGDKGAALQSFEKTYLYNCVFDSNTALAGGAIYQEGGELHLANTVFYNNSALNGPGGGIYALDATVSGFNTVFTENDVVTGGNGAAAYFEDSQATLINSTLTYNDATATTAAVYGLYSDMWILNCVFSENTAGLGLADAVCASGDLFLYGSIMQSATFSTWPGVTQTLASVGFIDILQPLLVDWFDSSHNFHAVDNGQVVVDHGYDDYIPQDWPDADGDGNTTEDFPYDMAGDPRVVGASIDAGAYESY